MKLSQIDFTARDEHSFYFDREVIDAVNEFAGVAEDWAEDEEIDLEEFFPN